MTKVPRIVGIILIVSGGIMIVVGALTYYLVHDQLSDENIVVSDDADNFAGEPVEGPFTAYAEANVIKKHTEELAGGLTYAELDREDPLRETVMQSSFLRASLFTSVVAFGVAFLVGALGVLFILIGITILAIAKSVGAPAPAGAHSAGAEHEEPAAAPTSAPTSRSSDAMFAPAPDDRP